VLHAFLYVYCSQVSQFASVLVSRGVQKGDRVLIYMPMIPEAMVAMLACARIGALHSLVFGGFASKELATRINHAEVGSVAVLISVELWGGTTNAK
jgi:acyl-coenzyme A synthetase/AMP-(fatty) acid ligase